MDGGGIMHICGYTTGDGGQAIVRGLSFSSTCTRPVSMVYVLVCVCVCSHLAQDLDEDARAARRLLLVQVDALLLF